MAEEPGLSPGAAGHGPIVLFGSGETARGGRQVHEEVLARYPRPVRVAVLPTPAGFQPNAALLTDRLVTFVEHNLGNHRPEVVVVAARRRGEDGDSDDPAVAALLDGARYILAGPGSPTYMVRQLAGTRTWAAVLDAWRSGAALALASAAAVAVGGLALPVYEIYKVGDDPRWSPGLDLGWQIGLSLAVVPHWNNAEGGAGLDTSRCFMGADRFERLRALLPSGTTVLGLDEHTSCIIDPVQGSVQVRGRGVMTVLRGEVEKMFPAGERVSIDVLGRGSGL